MFENDCSIEDFGQDINNDFKTTEDEQNNSEQSENKSDSLNSLFDLPDGVTEPSYTALESIDNSGKILVEILERELYSKQELARHLGQSARDSQRLVPQNPESPAKC
ncbi:MAG: hypothetical protein GY696_08170 [Gammaproteobacteria bacterium]|nr:hypothetical protein [Gammaproteobacteria bacterium]